MAVAKKKTAAKAPAAKKPAKRKTAAMKKAEEAAAAEEAAKNAIIVETPLIPGKRLDMERSEVKRMLAVSRKSGLLTTKELNKYIDLDGITTDEIEVILAQLSEMGISVYEEKDEPTLGPKTLARTTTTAVKGGNSKEELDRTDDPVRMYLREMGVVELLSREGEIAIAKRIEAGRDTMIKGLCESALTFEAIHPRRPFCAGCAPRENRKRRARSRRRRP